MHPPLQVKAEVDLVLREECGPPRGGFPYQGGEEIDEGSDKDKEDKREPPSECALHTCHTCKPLVTDVLLPVSYTIVWANARRKKPLALDFSSYLCHRVWYYLENKPPLYSSPLERLRRNYILAPTIPSPLNKGEKVQDEGLQ